MGRTTWRAEIERRMAAVGDAWSETVGHTGSLDATFDNGRDAPGGGDFLLWTRRRVYFPLRVEGYPRVGSAPRDPSEAHMKPSPLNEG